VSQVSTFTNTDILDLIAKIEKQGGVLDDLKRVILKRKREGE
jgi:hypothetical protein